MTKTGKFLTAEQVEELKQPVPYLVANGVEPESAQQKLHRYALQMGLPEIPGYYGADLKTGEILSA